MTNVELIARKLAILDDHLQRIMTRRPSSVDDFERDLLVQDAIAMSLLVVVQEAMDIALHIASDEGWELAATYRETFAVLARHDVIDAGLATALGDTATLRNRIAHGYATVDHARIWNELPGGIATMKAFASAIAVFVQSARG
jgi:uncharacterized protein YutE (UPF0331/DUF86 family)